MPGHFQITVGAGYRLTLPASVVAAHAPGLELVATAAPGGDGAGANHWRLDAPASFEASALPAFGQLQPVDVLRRVSSASWLTVTKARRLTLPASFRVPCPRPPFVVVLVDLSTHIEVWPLSAWDDEMKAAVRLPVALARLDLD